MNFAQRFNSGYGIIAPRNCYTGGQNTNCKINAMILQKYLEGERVFLFFFETSDYARIEHELIEALYPPFNYVSLPRHTASPYRQKQSDTSKTEEKQSFDAIWSRILASVGETFYTGGRQLEFTYKACGNAIISSRAQTTLLTKDNIKNAYFIMSNANATEFSKKIMGSSYVKAILSDPRINVK